MRNILPRALCSSDITKKDKIIKSLQPNLLRLGDFVWLVTSSVVYGT